MRRTGAAGIAGVVGSVGPVMDVDLHGVVGLRFVGPGPRDAAAVRRELGAFETPLARQPDLVVRFVDRLEARVLRYVELGRSGFTDDGFVVLAHGRRRAGVRLPFDRLDGPCEVVCERGRRALPVLLPVIKLLALRKGFVPLHASAFEYRGAGVIAAGWAHGGKTSALLAFAERGAAYVGDDLVLLGGDGRQMFGLPAPLELWDWQVEGVSAARRQAGRARLALGRAARRLGQLEARLPGGSEGGARGLLRRALPALQRRLKTEHALEALFEGRVALAAEPRTVFLMMSHAARDVRVEPADPGELAERLALSVQQEMLGLYEQYLGFRFAFPDRRSELVETAQAAAAELLRGALADKALYVVRHPYPVPLGELYAAMRPRCEAPPTPTAPPVGAAHA